MLLEIIPWIGNILIVIGLWQVGNKKRYAFILSIAGELLWVGYALQKNLNSLTVICLIFATIASINWFKWKA